MGDGYGAGVVDRLVDGAGNGGQPDLLARVRVYQPLYETGAARRMLADRRHDRNHPGDAGADVVLLRAAGRQVVRAALERLAVAGFSVDLRTAAGHPVPDAEILRRARDALQIRVDRLVRSPAKLLLHAGVDGGLVLNAVLRDDGPGSGQVGVLSRRPRIRALLRYGQVCRVQDDPAVVVRLPFDFEFGHLFREPAADLLVGIATLRPEHAVGVVERIVRVVRHDLLARLVLQVRTHIARAAADGAARDGPERDRFQQPLAQLAVLVVQFGRDGIAADGLERLLRGLLDRLAATHDERAGAESGDCAGSEPADDGGYGQGLGRTDQCAEPEGFYSGLLVRPMLLRLLVQADRVHRRAL